MKLFYKLFLIIGLFFSATNFALASPDAPKNGEDYLIVENPQPTNTGKKIEVIEFFGYFCSHCHSFDSKLAKWAEKQKNHIVFKRVHINFNDSMARQQRLFYTLSAMGKLSDSMHEKIFNAVQVRRTNMKEEKHIAKFVQKHQIDPEQFLEMYRSFTVQSLCDKATYLQDAYKIDAIPVIVIDGRYITSLAIVSDGNQFSGTEEQAQNMTIQVMDNLISRIKSERKK